MTESLSGPKNWTHMVGSLAWAFARGIVVNAPLAVLTAIVIATPAQTIVDQLSSFGFLTAAASDPGVVKWSLAIGIVVLSLALDLVVLSQPVSDGVHHHACRLSLIEAIANIYAREDFRGDPTKRQWAASVLYNAKMENFVGAWIMGLFALPVIALASMGPWWVVGGWWVWAPGWIWLVLVTKLVFIIIVAIDIVQMAWCRFTCAA